MRIKLFTKKADITQFLELLCSLLKSGLSVNYSLNSLYENPACSKFASSIKIRLEKSETVGHALSCLCKKMASYETMLMSAEKTGDIVPVLENITEELKEEKEEKNNIIIVSLYPVIITVFAFVLSLLLLIYGLPYIQQISDISRESVIKGIVYANIWLIFSVTVTLCIIIFFSKKTEYQYSFFRTLYYLSLNSVSIDDSIKIILRGNAKKTKQTKITAGILNGIREGKKLSGLCKEAGCFDVFCTAWLLAAEGTGEMTASFEKIFIHYKAERKRDKEASQRFLEPGIMLVTGIYILILVSVCVVPVFRNLGNSLF